jgi:hypothetical protein
MGGTTGLELAPSAVIVSGGGEFSSTEFAKKKSVL